MAETLNLPCLPTNRASLRPGVGSLWRGLAVVPIRKRPDRSLGKLTAEPFKQEVPRRDDHSSTSLPERNFIPCSRIISVSIMVT